MNEQHPRDPKSQRFTEKYHSALETSLGPIPPLPTVVLSRDVLLKVLGGLNGQQESLVVVGAHAVIERTLELESRFQAASTRDSDVGIIPSLLQDVPNLETTMAELGFERAHPDRPGIWGLTSERDVPFGERLTIDLIAPEALAGGKSRRSANVGVHGKSVTRAAGLELAAIDRDLLLVRTFGNEPPVEAYVAGSAALICAKTHKLHDRFRDADNGRDHRLRPKDANDVWRLMATSDPVAAAEQFQRGLADPTICSAVEHAYAALREMTLTRDKLQQLAARSGAPASAQETITSWSETFFAV